MGVVSVLKRMERYPVMCQGRHAECPGYRTWPHNRGKRGKVVEMYFKNVSRTNAGKYYQGKKSN